MPTGVLVLLSPLYCPPQILGRYCGGFVFLFYKWNVRGNPAPGQLVSAIFPTVFDLGYVCVSHFGNSCNIFCIFNIIIMFVMVSVIKIMTC